MRFGSVEFFKVLIKTVLTILFFVPLILAVVFGVLLAKKSASLREAEEGNTRLTAVADVLVDEKIGDIDDFCSIFDMSGISYEEFIRAINEKNQIDASEFYRILSDAGISDKDIITMAAEKNSVKAEEFYEIMTANGITDMDLFEAAAVKNGGGTAGYCKVLEECGVTVEEIAKYFNLTMAPVMPPEQQEPVEESPYAELYEDMYVQAPLEYNREINTIYLTFDDGPSQYTRNILGYLDEYGVKATFFVVPTRTEECYELLREIVNGGHSIGVHTASHEYNKIYESVEAYLADFYEAWDIIREATGVSTQIFRFAGGSINDYNEDTRDDIINEMTRRGFRYYDWNVDSGDAAGATWTDMYNSVPSDIANCERAFVLFHDTKYNTVLVLEDLLKVLKNEGYAFDRINDDTKPVQFIGPFS